jgi:enoyl-CoA hydratase/carnithine racemase
MEASRDKERPGLGTIKVSNVGRVAVVEISNTDHANALTVGMLTELEAAWRWFEDSGDLHVALLTGAGDRHFCAGADSQDLADDSLTGREEPVARWWPTAITSKPVVAAVNGIAVGAGMGLAVDCDLLVASKDASFFSPHVSLGIPCGFGVYRLASKVAPVEASRLALMGKHARLSAERAYDLGLVGALAASAKETKELGLEMAGTIADQSADAVAATLKLLRRVSWDEHELQLIGEAQQEVSSWTATIQPAKEP